MGKIKVKRKKDKGKSEKPALFISDYVSFSIIPAGKKEKGKR
jgi:hypothetical protein